MGQHANAWVDFTQTYFKIPVAKDGIYEIDYAQLQNAGFPITADPTTFQLFHRGKEHAISVLLGGDSQFDPGDVIRFYGQRNDGTLDSMLYNTPQEQPHRYHNLYSDTAVYFLTAGTVSGKRMTEVDDVDVGFPTVNSHIEQKLQLFTEQYAPGDNFNNELFDSRFGVGEGWSSVHFWNGLSRTITFGGITNQNPAGGLPRLELLIVGMNNRIHDVEVRVGPSLRVLKTIAFTGATHEVVDEEIAWEDISNGSLQVEVRNLTSSFANAIAISYVRLLYPQSLDASAASSKLLNISAGAPKSSLEIQNPAPGVVLYDVTTPAQAAIISTTSATTLKAIVSTSADRRLYLTNEFLPVSKLTPTKFRQFIPGAQDFIIISHPKLRKPAGQYADPVKAYAAYRASSEGGAYDTLLVNMQDLYDQFNYGERSSAAIYNFLRFVSAPVAPKYLFLIGKGLEVWSNFGRDANGGTASYQDLVPTGGFPGSDMIFSAGLNGSVHAPAIPTGRLSAMYPKQVAAYLDKVKEKEQIAVDNFWQKRILHLSGGIEDGEPEYFRSILEGYASVAQGPYLGAEVKSIAKKSRDLEVINISEEINNGLALVTFFGHSSTSTLDFDIGYISDPDLGYHNKGKYPVLLMNGCEVGAFFLRDTLFGESWINARDRGAAAFIAHNSYGLIGALSDYSGIFYETAFADSSMFGRGIGDVQKETAKRYMEDRSPSLFTRSQIQQMILLGDPAVRIFGTRKPDLEINGSQMSVVPFKGPKVTALSDSFAIRMILKNYGMARQDTFRIEVLRTLADNSTVVYDSLFQLPKNSDTINFIVRRGQELSAGTNTFTISVDADNIISETNESNNSATYSLVLPSNGTKNLYPTNFGIVSRTSLTLSLQATDLYSGRRGFIAEIDTTQQFDSPFKKSLAVEGEVLAMANVELLSDDSTAYYWRTRLADPQPGENDSWETSSFTFIDNSQDGWAQVHFPQFVDNVAVGLNRSDELRRIEFQKSVTPVEVTTFGSGAGKTPQDVSVKIKGQEYNLYSMVGGWFGCQDNTINFVAFDKRSTSPYIGVFLKWYELGGRRLSCGREPFVINSFTHSDIFNGGYRDIVQYVDNVADGDSVLLFNIGNANVALWPTEAKQKLSELGISASQLDGLASGEPVVIVGKKGSPAGEALVYRSNAAQPELSTLQVSRTISGGYDQGTMETSLIGPAAEWHSLHVKSMEVQNQDVVRFDLIGVSLNGVEEVIQQDVARDVDLSTIDPETFPYLRLKFSTQDPVLLTSAQLDRWIVHFTPVPEGVLLPDSDNISLSLTEGEEWERGFRFVNISEHSFSDSVRVQLSIYNHQKSEVHVDEFNIKAPLPMDTAHFAVGGSSLGFSGTNDVTVFVNPKIVAEQHYDNNVAQLAAFLVVGSEVIPPVIDVMFDGRFIRPGDFVSSSPEIIIRVYDENEFLPRVDTLGLQLRMAGPCANAPCTDRPIWFSRADVAWTPTSSTTPFMTYFRPEGLVAGEYNMTITARDVSGNSAQPVEIKFKVSNDHHLHISLPYPNPFQWSTNYGFELTGGDVPSNMRLNIYDLAGRPLYSREFTGDSFTVGRNEFVWDGKDNSGNWIGSGIYIAEIIVIDAGDQHVVKGKLAISR
jgi:hypothetical protein